MKFWVILLGVLGILGISGFFVLNNLNSTGVLSKSARTKALQNVLGREVHLSSQDQTVWNTYKSKYIEFSYPSWAVIYTKDDEEAKKDGNNLDIFSFFLADWHITAVIQVIKFTERLTEFPSVNLRLSQNDIYIVSKNSASEIDFSKDRDNVERSAFLLGNGDVVSVAVTGYSKSSVESIFTKIVSSLNLL